MRVHGKAVVCVSSDSRGSGSESLALPTSLEMINLEDNLISEWSQVLALGNLPG